MYGFHRGVLIEVEVIPYTADSTKERTYVLQREEVVIGTAVVGQMVVRPSW